MRNVIRNVMRNVTCNAVELNAHKHWGFSLFDKKQGYQNGRIWSQQYIGGIIPVWGVRLWEFHAKKG